MSYVLPLLPAVGKVLARYLRLHGDPTHYCPAPCLRRKRCRSVSSRCRAIQHPRHAAKAAGIQTFMESQSSIQTRLWARSGYVRAGSLLGHRDSLRFVRQSYGDADAAWKFKTVTLWITIQFRSSAGPLQANTNGERVRSLPAVPLPSPQRSACVRSEHALAPVKNWFSCPTSSAGKRWSP